MSRISLVKEHVDGWEGTIHISCGYWVTALVDNAHEIANCPTYALSQRKVF